MKRKIIDELIAWKTEDNGRPILLTGAKGVGKTYLAYDFAKAFFEQSFYINFERETKIAELFSSNNPEQITQCLTQHFQLEQDNAMSARVLILDEISYCKEALRLLGSMSLTSIFRFIICISSNPLPEEYSQYSPRLAVHPLEFDEFLLATGNEWYVEAVITHYNLDKKLPDIVHKELLNLHELYLQIGGIPGMINEYLNFSSVVNISERHNVLIASYHDYIQRDNSDGDALKMKQVFDSLTLQLIKDNKKFQYKLIRKGTTHAMYKDAIQKLCDGNYIVKCNRISNEQLLHPEETFQSKEWKSIEANTNFKLYMPDTGLLYTKITEEQELVSDLSQRKALLENYVAQSLQAKNYPFAFWESDSMAKIDFVYLKKDLLLPIEIYTDANTRSKSISILKQKCQFPYSIKISSKNFEFSNQVKYVPYYAVFCL